MNLFSYFPYDEPDPRTNEWLSIRTPYIVLFVIFNYLYFVLRCGPLYMKNRPAYDLKTFMKYYNVFQIVTNALILYYGFKFGLFTEIPIACAPLDPSPDGNAMKMAVMFWWVLMLKIVDLIETVVFVLRKKTNQVTFLHLYHHTAIVLFIWLMVKISPGGWLAYHMALNNFVHVIMYSYYLGSSGGPMMQLLVSPIKKYITMIQMSQFIILLVHVTHAYLSGCDVARWSLHLSVANLGINLTLFYNFYRSSYDKSKKPKSRGPTADVELKFN